MKTALWMLKRSSVDRQMKALNSTPNSRHPALIYSHCSADPLPLRPSSSCKRIGPRIPLPCSHWSAGCDNNVRICGFVNLLKNIESRQTVPEMQK